jgi:hypothetical protein
VLIDPMLRQQARSLGAKHGVAMAEAFRVVRFGGFGDLLARFGEPL